MRSGWKSNYISEADLHGILQFVRKKRKPTVLRIVSRSTTITPIFVGKKVMVHQGRNYAKFTVKDFMLGHKFGEYAQTRLVGADMHFRKKGKKAVQTTGRKK